MIAQRKTVTRSLAFAARVRRYHTWPVIHQETVGEHTCRVYTIYYELFGIPRAEVAYMIMVHDMPEVAVGDPPFPVKVKSPTIKQAYKKLEEEVAGEMGIRARWISEEEERRIKICDYLQMLEFGRIEYAMGNKYAQPIIDEITTSVIVLAAKDDDELNILWWMREKGHGQ